MYKFFEIGLKDVIQSDPSYVSAALLLRRVEARQSLYATRFTNDEAIIVQGIIDMLIRTPKGLVIIDFKTDNITPGQVSERAELYRRQLNLYSRAASAILKSKTIAKRLYFLSPSTEFEFK